MDVSFIFSSKPRVIFLQNTWGGEYYVPLTMNITTSTVAALRCSKLGDLNSLYWLQLPQIDTQLDGVKVWVRGLYVITNSIGTLM